MGIQMLSKKEVSGIILAGGKSRRFGTNKALYEYQNKKLVEYAIAVLAPLCGNILISTSLEQDFSFTGLQTVNDRYPDSGPVAGIHACLQKSSTDHNLVIGCDLPFLKEDLLKYILQKSTAYQVVIPMQHYFKETMVGYYHKSCMQVLEQALRFKQYKILDAINPLATLFLEVSHQPFYSEHLFTNINYHHDLPSNKNPESDSV
jgi:molybdenum cofactor guanylyltransferase